MRTWLPAGGTADAAWGMAKVPPRLASSVCSLATQRVEGQLALLAVAQPKWAITHLCVVPERWAGGSAIAVLDKATRGVLSRSALHKAFRLKQVKRRDARDPTVLRGVAKNEIIADGSSILIRRAFVVAGAEGGGRGGTPKRRESARTFLPASACSWIKNRVLFMDEDEDGVIVIDKPYGIACQGGARLDGTPTVDRCLSELRFGRDAAPRLVHRLDKDCTGVMILSRSRASLSRLFDAFAHATNVLMPQMLHGLGEWRSDLNAEARSTEMWSRYVKDARILKSYWAVARVAGPRGKRNAILHSASQYGFSASRIEGRDALTLFRVQAQQGDLALVKCVPVSGRRHQIRRHLAMAGLPIVGERKYVGRSKCGGSAPSDKLHLHSASVRFGNGGCAVEAALPQHIRDTLLRQGLIHGSRGADSLNDDRSPG